MRKAWCVPQLFNSSFSSFHPSSVFPSGDRTDESQSLWRRIRARLGDPSSRSNTLSSPYKTYLLRLSSVHLRFPSLPSFCTISFPSSGTPSMLDATITFPLFLIKIPLTLVHSNYNIIKFLTTYEQFSLLRFNIIDDLDYRRGDKKKRKEESSVDGTGVKRWEINHTHARDRGLASLEFFILFFS